MDQLILGIIGISAGFTVAGGVIALITGLKIIIRFAGITHTGISVRYYETAIILGSVFGNLMTIHQTSIPVGTIGLCALGLFSGIFVGGWIMALAEVVNIFPVFTRRIGITKGISIIILFLAAGKLVGNLMHFYLRW